MSEQNTLLESVIQNTEVPQKKFVKRKTLVRLEQQRVKFQTERKFKLYLRASILDPLKIVLPGSKLMQNKEYDGSIKIQTLSLSKEGFVFDNILLDEMPDYINYVLASAITGYRYNTYDFGVCSNRINFNKVIEHALIKIYENVFYNVIHKSNQKYFSSHLTIAGCSASFEVNNCDYIDTPSPYSRHIYKSCVIG